MRFLAKSAGLVRSILFNMPRHSVIYTAKERDYGCYAERLLRRLGGDGMLRVAGTSIAGIAERAQRGERNA